MLGFFSGFRRPGLPSSCDVQASRCGGFSSCRAQAVGASLWPPGLAAPLRVEASQIRDQTGVPGLQARFLSTAPPGKPYHASYPFISFCSASYPFITFSYFLIKEFFVYFGYLSLVCYIGYKSSYLPFFF